MTTRLENFIIACYKLSVMVSPRFDSFFLKKDIPMANIASHQNWQAYLYRLGNQPGMRILEVGSREVVGESVARKKFFKAEYIGFDYYPGRNVDVVGDAHKLSSYFDGHEKFDIIYLNK